MELVIAIFVGMFTIITGLAAYKRINKDGES